MKGIDAAMERAHAYVEAGADVLFVEAPQDLEQMQRICRELGPHIPLLANMVEGGDTPISCAEDLQRMGYSLVIFPGAMVRASSRACMNLLSPLKQNGNTRGMSKKMLDFNQFNVLLETEKLLARGEAYAESKFPK